MSLIQFVMPQTGLRNHKSHVHTCWGTPLEVGLPLNMSTDSSRFLEPSLKRCHDQQLIYSSTAISWVTKLLNSNEFLEEQYLETNSHLFHSFCSVKLNRSLASLLCSHKVASTSRRGFSSLPSKCIFSSHKIVNLYLYCSSA